MTKLCELCRGMQDGSIDYNLNFGSDWLHYHGKRCDGCAILLEALHPYLVSRHSAAIYLFRVSRKGAIYAISVHDWSGTGALKLDGADVKVVLRARQGIQNPWNMLPLDGSDILDTNPRPLMRCQNWVVHAPLVYGDSTWMPASKRLALNWLENCTRHHKHTCGSRETGYPLLPTRVVDIGDLPAETVVVRETASQRGRYICLSYCWGNSQFIKSTQSNIQAHRNGIPMRDLPQVFQDFIQVARDFNVRYVWIDSLCIIQDSDDDWQKEAGKMSEVYHNAFLTVAASGARNPLDGCFAERAESEVGPILCRPILGFPQKAISNNFPLFERAWSLQERLLSPRVLHFGPSEISWECNELHTCECGESMGYTSGLSIVRKGPFFASILSSVPNTQPWNDPPMLWRKLVIQYSNLRMTKASDKLPAISGLANIWRPVHGHDYLAGLWRDTIVADLAWLVDHQRTTSSPLQAPAPGDEGWRAPSWSWAAIDGPILYDGFLYNTWTGAFEEEYCQVIAAECIPLGESETGRLASGYLKLRCRLLAVSHDNGSVSLPSGSYTARFDYPSSAVGDKLYVTRLGRHKETYDLLLVLQAAEGQDNVFRRVGVLYVHDRNSLQWPEDEVEPIII